MVLVDTPTHVKNVVCWTRAYGNSARYDQRHAACTASAGQTAAAEHNHILLQGAYGGMPARDAHASCPALYEGIKKEKARVAHLR